MARPQIDDNRIFEAALREFATRSYEEASLNAILANAAVSKGSFYYRFKDKFSLYLFVLKEAKRRKWEFIKAELAGAETAAALLNSLLAQARAGLNFARRHPELHRLGRNFAAERGTELYETALRELGSSDESGLAEAIERACRRGEFDGLFPPAFLQRLLPLLLESFDRLSESELPDSQLLEDFELLVTFIRRGLEPR